MYYVIIDPSQDYAFHMMQFLGGFGYKAIAVFSAPQEYHAWRFFGQKNLGHLVVDEFLATEYPSLDAMAARIHHDVPGEIVGIIPWAEFTTLFGAEVGAALGIDWNPPEVIRCFRNKFAMKDALRAHGGVRINASRVVSSVEDAIDFVQQVGTWPIVVKPTEGAGSRAVTFAHSLDELIAGAQKVFHQGDGEILLEEFIGGIEYVCNGITDAQGQMLVTDVWVYDKRDVGPHKNIYFQTIKVSSFDPVWMPIARYATSVIHALGLRKAPVHMELKVDERGPCMVEVGCRFAGGNQPLLASELHGRSLFELAAVHYLGGGRISWDDVHYDRYDARFARIISGVQTEHLHQVRHLLGVEDVKRLPSFYGFGKLIPPGASVPVTSDLLSKSYEVYLFHTDPEQVEHDAHHVRRLLHYV